VPSCSGQANHGRPLCARPACGTSRRLGLGGCEFIPVLSAESAQSGWTGCRGMVTEFVASALPDADWSQVEGYLCGPPGMVDAAIDCPDRTRQRSGVDSLRQVHRRKPRRCANLAARKHPSGGEQRDRRNSDRPGENQIAHRGASGSTPPRANASRWRIPPLRNGSPQCHGPAPKRSTEP